MQELKEYEELHWFCLNCKEDIRGAFRDKVIRINKRIELLEQEVNRRMKEMVRRDEITDVGMRIFPETLKRSETFWKFPKKKSETFRNFPIYRPSTLLLKF